jgi:hypothetical protein
MSCGLQCRRGQSNTYGLTGDGKLDDADLNVASHFAVQNGEIDPLIRPPSLLAQVVFSQSPTTAVRRWRGNLPNTG